MQAYLDMDIVAYRLAFRTDTEGLEDVEMYVRKAIDAWIPMEATGITLCLSCPRDSNFRRSYWDPYKRHRDDKSAPDTMQHVIEEIYNSGFPVMCLDKIEADDLLGICATEGGVAVTVDKDLRQVPGIHWNPDKEKEPVLVSQEEADRFLYSQWITGDSTDNIWGLWKCGPARATKVLDTNEERSWWDTIINMYRTEKRPNEKAIPEGMSVDDFALSQFVCVKILRSGDYDFIDGKVGYWADPNKTLQVRG